MKVSVGDNFYKPKTVESGVASRSAGATGRGAHVTSARRTATPTLTHAALRAEAHDPGSLHYCTIHGKAVMSGTVTVTR